MTLFTCTAKQKAENNQVNCISCTTIFSYKKYTIYFDYFVFLIWWTLMFVRENYNLNNGLQLIYNKNCVRLQISELDSWSSKCCCVNAECRHVKSLGHVKSFTLIFKLGLKVLGCIYRLEVRNWVQVLRVLPPGKARSKLS